MDSIGLLIGSVQLRPYIFAFFGLMLASAVPALGLRRALAFTVIGWAVAFAAEFSSIRIGIPFGFYYYIPATADRELWIGGVPFADSFSFTFLIYASYSTALVLLRPLRREGRWLVVGRPEQAWARATGLGAALLILLDVVIDPVALRGDRWFLGKLYGYYEPGWYFGIPMANFIGWGLVGLVAMVLYRLADRSLLREQARRRPDLRMPLGLMGPVLYGMVLAFNLGVTFAIGEWLLGMAGLALSTPVLALLGRRVAGALAARGEAVDLSPVAGGVCSG
ncbi:MAG: carotenoid biosynthesis protein [Deltaproteobacteria bacterium]|nr:carotenoid biosynthesis protein [Deltaproteobacteria bacterium]